jgi:hypothetical protein
VKAVSQTGKPVPKTLYLPCDSKGGVCKSTSSAFIADALNTLGYKVGIAEADTHNKTMLQFFPGIPVISIEKQEDINRLFHAVVTGDQDLFICDLPGTFSIKLAGYLQKLGSRTLQEANLRIVVALAINETQDSVNGVFQWVRYIAGLADFIVVATGDRSEGDFVDFKKLKGAEDLVAICENRVLHIPKIPADRFEEFKQAKLVLSKLVPNEGKVDATNLSFWSRRNWVQYQYQVVSNVAKYAQWLTGKKIPNDSFLAKEDKPDAPDQVDSITEKLALFGEKIEPFLNPKK